MKSFKHLAASLVLIATAFTACQREEIFSGIDSSRPAVSDFQCADAAYDGKTAVMSWNADKAVAAGATSFTLQFVKDKDGGNPDNYNTTLSTTVMVEKGVSEYQGKISGQTKGNTYYVRVRANYRNSIYSEWVWLTYDNGEPALFKLGRGIITEGIEEPYLYKVTPTSTGLIIKWDIIEGANNYIIEYKKSAENEWTALSFDAGTSMCKIGDLPSETSYDVRALTVTEAGSSDYSAIQTVSTRQPGSFPKQMGTADELIAWLEGGVVEVESTDVYEIIADINLDGATFATMEEPLLGTLNGNGHTISGLSTALMYRNEGTIKDLNISGSVKFAEDDITYGSLVTYNAGTISNVKSNVSVSYSTSSDAEIFIGGLCCYNEGIIENSTNEGTLTVTQKASSTKLICIGGIASVSQGELKSAKNLGGVSYTNELDVLAPAIAGIAGYIEGSAIDCVNEGAVTLQALYSRADADNKGILPQLDGKIYTSATYATPAAAGIAAYSYSEDSGKALLDNCVNNGAVQFIMTDISKYTTTVQRVQAAGIIANPYGLIKDCTNNGKLLFAARTKDGNASGGTYLMCCGGIGGADYFCLDQATTTYDGCINNGEIECDKFDKAGSSNSTLGGICGWPGAEGARSNVTKNCKNNGTIILNGTGKVRVGGIHGGTGNIENCTNEGDILCNNTNAALAIGGVAGFLSQGHAMKNCVNTGNVTASGANTQGVGGLIGNAGNVENKSIWGCSVKGTITNPGTAEQTGMIVGYFNGNSKTYKIGTDSAPIKVKGTIVIGGTKTKLTASNYSGFLNGSKNFLASAHVITAVFDDSIDEGETPATPTAPEITLTPGSGNILVEWNAIENAQYYIVEYKKASASEWIVAATTSETSYKITGLDLSSTYNVRVKAVFSDGDFSSEGSVTTEGEPQKLETPVVTAVPFYTDAIAKWAAVENATNYDVYVDGVLAGNTSELTWRASGFKNASSHSFSVEAKSETLGSDKGTAEFTTGTITQVRNNVGPTHLSVEFTDCSGGSGNADRFFQLQVAKDAAGSDIIYSVYTFDGQASANGSFGSSSWLGKPNGSNAVPKTRVSFGFLSPSTTYYVRVKTAELKDFVCGFDSKARSFAAKNGVSEWSEWVAFQTEASHTPVQNEIIFEGFDEATMQADFVNASAGLTPRTGAKGGAAITWPWTGTDENAWAAYPFANSHLFKTWGLAEQVGEDTFYTINSSKLPSLGGWSYNDQLAPQMGSVKLGNSSAAGFYIATPALSGIGTSESACTLTFKVCALSTSGAPEGDESITINVNSVNATTVKLTYDAVDAAMNYQWRTSTIDLQLKDGDVVSIQTGNKVRVMLDDILIVKK